VPTPQQYADATTPDAAKDPGYGDPVTNCINGGEVDSSLEERN
jgi:hypothetical protein